MEMEKVMCEILSMLSLCEYNTTQSNNIDFHKHVSMYTKFYSWLVRDRSMCIYLPVVASFLLWPNSGTQGRDDSGVRVKCTCRKSTCF